MNTIYDPLTINLHGQTRKFLAKLPATSPYAASLLNASSRAELLEILSHLLAVPGLTLSVATTFRPILLDLCARWLHDEDNAEDRLGALCLLIEVHEELYPILSALLKKSVFANGPLAFIVTDPSLKSFESSRIHKLLLAYYRLLQVNRELPTHLLWPLSPLSQLFWTPYPDTGVRLLAIRCYALQSGMGEAEREALEKQVLGETCGIDCPVEYGCDFEGRSKSIDGWLLPVLEVQRVAEARTLMVTDVQDYYTREDGDLSQPIHPSELSPFIANIHGVLLLRSQTFEETHSNLIATPTAIESLRNLAIHLSLRLPTLLTSVPSAGKSLRLQHLAASLHPGVKNHIITIHLADTSLDPRSLLGSYVSSVTQPGTFEWKEGVLVRAMREGRWVVFADIDRGSSEVLGVIKPLIESLGPAKWIGGRASLEVPSRGRIVAHEGFAVFATRSIAPARSGRFPDPVFFGAHKFHEVIIQSPSAQELQTIVDAQFPRLAGSAACALIRLWQAVRALGPAASAREVGMRELHMFGVRVNNVLPSSYQGMDLDLDADAPLSAIFPHPTLREDIYLEARDIFFGAGSLTAASRAHSDNIAALIAEHLGLDTDRREWVLNGRTPEFIVEKDVDGRTTAVRVGRTRLPAKSTKRSLLPPPTRPFAMHRPAVLLLSRIANAVALGEPVLLTGETGTGKTSVVTHLASLLRRPLISLNLSHQTESSDLVGGFKPVDVRIPGSALQELFLELFGGTFSRRKNAAFEESVRKAVGEGKWKRAVGLWKESARLAKDRIQAKEDVVPPPADGGLDSDTPRKRRKVNHEGLNVSRDSWEAFEKSVDEFDVQHVQAKGKFAFSFVEGPLVKALKYGDWVLLDEINLASPETLECISGLLHGPTASITLTEQGSLEPVPRHPDFRLFACMNPATDVGKKDLPPSIRSRFTEIDVLPPDADRDTLLGIITQYIGPTAVGDKAVIMNVAEFYAAVKDLSQKRQIADGANHRPNYSMRTLARALTFTADMASTYSLRRALWEGCLMAFTMVLDSPSAEVVTALARKHLLAGVRNPRSLLSKEPAVPSSRTAGEFVKLGPFYLEKGPFPEDSVDDYIMTPSVETKLIDLARIIVTRRFPVLIEGPTSSGKTSSVEYLARRTGHRFVRINNHEHTDIQEYLGSYVSDPTTGKLVFKDGLLVRALRTGDWIVLDELNLAPTDVLEALNRLLDDNRELIIPETQEVVIPHPHFMLFATQNPPGLYAGRKILSRAFRNRFLEVHFEDVPQSELETILCQRCRIAPSYGQKIVTVFRELQKRRQASRVFESKHGFATLRDLFRWAGRDAVGYQELADNGYMLLAERTRREDDKQIVKDVIESVMKVSIDETRLYDFQSAVGGPATFLGCTPPSSSLVWTSAMQRLFVLLSRALKFNEPVLLVGETGSGKTSVCQVYADAVTKHMHSLNCHQNTETADLIGGLRPIRNRSAAEAQVLREVATVLTELGVTNVEDDSQAMTSAIDNILKSSEDLTAPMRTALADARVKVVHLSSIFEWHDGPLVDAMRNGDVFLLDEISLADDSVLERLNSVLEPARTIVLAERGGDDLQNPIIRADENFKLVATMNPGGDYGKKELSPALRNRFTEIWVPAVEDRRDLELIVNSLWVSDSLKMHTHGVLDFAEWLCSAVGDRSLLNLRDILAWVTFTNAVYRENEGSMTPNEIFHHAAHMSFLDGLASMPQLATYSMDALRRLKHAASTKLQEIMPFVEADVPTTWTPSYDTSRFVQLGSFAIPRGSDGAVSHDFNFQAPTTRENAMRVVRASQVMKPILLEGSPGVGKTSLITALARLAGHRLCRINLSDQTDLIDLFGSDLPVEGGGPGQFAWRDAEFLKALQEGHWVLLDEMNLAPQAILEGLNAVLDHRGTVYIPELGRSFVRHPDFRVFAAQNPLHQGGGRKGLPKSFMNRFTKVYIEQLTPDDLLFVCRYVFPHHDSDIMRAMIAFNTRLTDDIATKRTFARDGSPWEFNLRDVLRWGYLMERDSSQHPIDHLRSVYLHRFRAYADRDHARHLFGEVFGVSTDHLLQTPPVCISSTLFQVGKFIRPRNNFAVLSRPPKILQAHLSALESIGNCVTQGWLAIVTGPHNSGKTEVVRHLANSTGNILHEVSVNSATDIMDIIGSFEQVDHRGRVAAVVRETLFLLDDELRTISGTKSRLTHDCRALRHSLQISATSHNTLPILRLALGLLDEIGQSEVSDGIRNRINSLLLTTAAAGSFEWIDGPLVLAMKQGHWLLLDGANLCNPAVLDRLNSLCEPDGVLTLSERGFVDGSVEVVKPHPDFRLFMSVDPRYGELSRAMRNRGIEVALLGDFNAEDRGRLLDHLRLPVVFSPAEGDVKVASAMFDGIRRGLLPHIELNSLDSPCPSGHVLDQDSTSSALIAQSTFLPVTGPLLNARADALLYFFSRVVAPTHRLHFHRLLRTFDIEVKSFAHRLGALLESVTEQFQEHGTGTDSLCGMFAQIENLEFFLLYDDFNHGPHVPTNRNIILHALDLLVILAINEGESSHQNRAHSLTKFGPSTPGVSTVDQRALNEIESLLQILPTIGNALLKGLGYSQQDMTLDRDIQLILKLMRYARYLRLVAGGNAFDYSAIQTVSGWIMGALKEAYSPTFATIANIAQLLEDAVSLSRGLGLSEIWTSLSTHHLSEAASLDLHLLERLAYRAKDDATVGLRTQVFEIMALQRLPSSIATKEDKTALSQLGHQIQTRLVDNYSAEISESIYLDNPSWVVSELVVLAMFSGLHCSNSAMLSEAIHDMIQIVREDAQTSLLRFVPYQHMLWAVQAEKDCPALILQSQVQWLQSLWTAPFPHASLLGPSALLHPAKLFTTIHDCDSGRNSLASLEAYERSIRYHVRLAFLDRSVDASRLQQLSATLIHGIFAVCISFAGSFSISDVQSMRTLSSDHRLGTPASMHEVLSLLKGLSHGPLAQAFQRHLYPTLLHLTSAKPRAHLITHLGRSYIAFSRFVMDLYVPDIPIDPAAIHHCAVVFWRQQESALSLQMELHLALEKRSTGNARNVIIDYIASQLAEVRDRLSALENFPPYARHDVRRLHTFWTEVSQFRVHVIASSKVDPLVDLLERGDASASMRESVLQESLAGFSQRLDTVYPDYADLTPPLHWALQQMKLGLRLVAHAMACNSESGPHTETASALVSFPSVRSGSMLRSTPVPKTTSGIPALEHVLLQLAGVAFDSSIGVDHREHLHSVQTIYDQALRLWLIDRAREKETEQLSQSLYKRKAVEYDAASEAEMEEKDFRSLFPDFEDTLDQEAHPKAADGRQPLLVDASDVKQLVSMHHVFVNNSGWTVESPISAHIFIAMRKAALKSLLDSRVGLLPETLDSESLPFRLSLLHERLSTLEGSTAPSDGPYNFYVDSNVTELKKAATVLKTLKARLAVLIQEWPDQMVLQHLSERCDMVLALDLHSPVAKVLAALEQLLMQSEDWEIYANRENTLKVHRSALTGLIVDWRRLELSCWHALLQSQADTFATGSCESWFHLYDATVRGPMDAADKEEEGVSEALSIYLKQLIPLLDDFIRSSPLGQFEARAALVQSFSVYTGLVAQSKLDRHRLALERVQRILHATADYYGFFSQRISVYLKDQRIVLEKDIRAFIKLASWKDINVHALKQSAQRTHRQLYKVVRKFRDLLRQPIDSRLVPELAGENECKADLSDVPANLIVPAERPTFPDPPPTALTSSHLADLGRTFTKFNMLISDRIASFIESHSAHLVDDFAVDIITTAKHLSSVPINSEDPPEKRVKRQKALLVRKRKAWSDLLKEMKRTGFAANVKPDVLTRLRDELWIREQPCTLSTDDTIPLAKGQRYFNRLQNALPLLRASLSNHHSDLTTRELQRGVMLLESSFATALEARSCLAGALKDYDKLAHMSRRLQMLVTSPAISQSGAGILDYVQTTADTTCKLASALDELVSGLKTFNSLKPHDTGFGSIEHDAMSMKASTETLRDRLINMGKNMRLTCFPIILRDEHDLLLEASQHLYHTCEVLQSWLNQAPDVKYLLYPVYLWLMGALAPVPSSEPNQSPQANATDATIDILLITVQTVLGRCVDPSEADSERRIRDESRMVRDVTRALHPGEITEKLDLVLREFALQPVLELQRNIGRLLPFVERYKILVHAQLQAQSSWVNALFKLAFVLCSIMRTLSQEGFCQPPDGDDAGAGGEVTDAAGGVGMGEGSGAENVSKEIEDESQVEGLQGDGVEPNKDQGEAEKDNAIEMSEDVGGEMEDVPDNGSEEDDASDGESQADPEEQIEKLDSKDASAVDEKLWGDEKGPDATDDTDGKTNEDHSKEEGKDSEVAAKEQGNSRKDKRSQEGNEDRPSAPDEQATEDVDEGDGPDANDEEPNPTGAPMDDHVQDANTLDLPEDLDLGSGEEMEETAGAGDEEDVDNNDMDVDVDSHQDFPEDEGPEQKDVDQSADDDPMAPDEHEGGPPAADHPEDVEGEETKEDSVEPDEQGVARPDVTPGEGAIAPEEAHDSGDTEDASTGQKGKSGGASGQQQNGDDEHVDQGSQQLSDPSSDPQIGEATNAGSANSGTQQGHAPSRSDAQLVSNPLRSLGDALKEIHQRFEEILNSQETSNPAPASLGDAPSAPQLEYVRPDEGLEEDMQALGSAGEDQVAKLNDLKIIDDRSQVDESAQPMDIDPATESDNHKRPNPKSSLQTEPTTRTMGEGVEGAVVRDEVPADQALERITSLDDTSVPNADVDMEDQNADVESELKRWQADGLPDDNAEHMWRLYESLTQDLAYALCEQLRLILEPTLATRLKGDYRTGKRLNMKKIISYIASDYTKDKIWLRRTRPSQREYQVLIALDDSQSMAESHSVHLAYETLALVSKALGRLEVGDIAIAKFGEAVEVLHGFDEGPFSGPAGAKVMSAFRFNQKATNVSALMGTSLRVLETARERRSMSSSSAADLWQLQIIISDGICQDHESLRTALRKAEEQRVMVVFIVIDSLHSAAAAKEGADSKGGDATAAAHNSILSMNKVAWKNVNGAMEMQLERYLDSFPFEYYVVLRSVEALPEVLSSTLKQFFERVSEE